MSDESEFSIERDIYPNETTYKKLFEHECLKDSINKKFKQLRQNSTLKSKDGSVRRICDLTDSHLINWYKKMVRENAPEKDRWLAYTEIKFRKIKLCSLIRKEV